jgi:hypothetical protein
MKTVKISPCLLLITLFLNLPMFGQSDSWKDAYTDIEVNFSNLDVTIGLAGGYKINRFVGVGLKFEKSIEFDNFNILSLNFRGTNYRPGDRWSFYYTASLGKGFGDFKLDHYDLAIGVRYERFGIGLGLYDNEVNFKISQLLGDFKGRGTLLEKVFSPTPKKRNDKTIENDSKSKRSTYFHFLLGWNSVNDEPSTLMNYSYGAITSNLGGGVQVNNYIGYGAALRGAVSFNPNSSNLNFLAFGANFNGYPNIFFYNVTLGAVLNYSLVNDSEYPGIVFKKNKGAPLFFEIKSGVRLFRKLSIGMSYFASSKVKGNYKKYEYDFSTFEKILIIDEERQSKFSGIQFFIGMAI